MAKVSFPRHFFWGAATSSYQDEGAAHEDGRGESILGSLRAHAWQGQDRSNGDASPATITTASADDIALMKRSASRPIASPGWPGRGIQPSGRGRPNQPGLDFLQRLVDALLEASIVPCATLYHWDLPQALQDEGGWPSRTAEAFVGRHASIVSRALDDHKSADHPATSPGALALLSHEKGSTRPRPSRTGAPRPAASHHLLLSHGWAVLVVRRESPGAEVGITLSLIGVLRCWRRPAPPTTTLAATAMGIFNRWFLDPIHGRSYPADPHDRPDVAAGRLPPEGLTVVRTG